ncbi:hypothetical protein KKA13_01050 [Patescibacteria group bacterium]|nr:hypothetical protein [Patescibacteria group bacterium]
MSGLKRILLITLLLLLAAVIGLGIYFVFFKKVPISQIIPSLRPIITPGALPPSGEAVPPTGEPTPPTAPALPSAGVIPQPPTPSYAQPAPVTRLTSESAAFPSLNESSASVRYHNTADGKFYRIGTDGIPQALTDQVFYNVSNVTWAKTQDKAVLEYPDGSKVVYNFNLQKQTTTLPKHWSEFSFSPEGGQIVAKSMGLSPENRWLITTNDDGTGTKTIEPMGNNADQVIVDWSPNRQVLAFAQTGEAQSGYRREVLFVGQNHENFKSTIVEGLGFQPSWSPTGNKLIYSVYSARSDFKPELWIVNSSGDQIGSGRQALQLNTWADKCAFADDDVVYCAVPRDMPQGAGISPAVVSNSYYDLFRIDARTGLKQGVPLGGDYRIKEMVFDQKNNKLFFTDSAQSGVFEVNI